MSFASTHKLPFEAAPWEFNDLLPVSPDSPILRFRIGTCEGIFFSDKESYTIIAIDNKYPGNGHLQDVFDWFENSCKRDKKSLRFVDIINHRFLKHLKEKQSFKGNSDMLEKKFK